MSAVRWLILKSTNASLQNILLYEASTRSPQSHPCLNSFFLTVSIVAVSYIRIEGGVRVCGDAVLRYFWCGFAVIFILTRGIAVSKH